MSIPLSNNAQHGQKHIYPLKTAEHALHPWVAFVILPLFAFANAGVSLTGVSLPIVLQTVPLGIAVGLVVGKAAGVFSASWLIIKLTNAKIPTGAYCCHIFPARARCLCFVRRGFYDEFVYWWFSFRKRGNSLHHTIENWCTTWVNRIWSARSSDIVTLTKVNCSMI